MLVEFLSPSDKFQRFTQEQQAAAGPYLSELLPMLPDLLQLQRGWGTLQGEIRINTTDAEDGDQQVYQAGRRVFSSLGWLRDLVRFT